MAWVPYTDPETGVTIRTGAPAGTVARVVELYESGASQEGIEAETGVPARTWATWLRRLGRVRWTEYTHDRTGRTIRVKAPLGRVRRVVELYEGAVTVAEIVARTGVKGTTAKAWLRGLGLVEGRSARNIRHASKGVGVDLGAMRAEALVMRALDDAPTRVIRAALAERYGYSPARNVVNKWLREHGLSYRQSGRVERAAAGVAISLAKGGDGGGDRLAQRGGRRAMAVRTADRHPEELVREVVGEAERMAGVQWRRYGPMMRAGGRAVEVGDVRGVAVEEALRKLGRLDARLGREELVGRSAAAASYAARQAVERALGLGGATGHRQEPLAAAGRLTDAKNEYVMTALAVEEGEGVDVMALGEEGTRRLVAFLGGLEEEERVVWVRMRLKGESYRQVSRDTTIPATTVQHCLRRADVAFGEEFGTTLRRTPTP